MKGLVLSRDIRDLIGRLAARKVRYLVVGGMAVVYHGYARLTGDIDLFYEPAKVNADRLYRALEEFFGGPVPSVDSAVDLLEKSTVIQFGVRPNRVDLMNSITGVTFKEAWAGRVVETIETTFGKYALPIIGLAALKKNKNALGRYKDLDDLQYLRPRAKKRPPVD